MGLARISFYLMIAVLPLTGCQTLPRATTQSSGASDTSSDAFATDEGFRDWFAFYYLKPKPEELTQAMVYMDRNRYLEQFPDIASAFLTHVLRANPERLDLWVREWRDLSPNAWNVILLSLWLADTPKTATLARQSLSHIGPSARSRYEAMLDQDPQTMDLVTSPVRSPRQINVIWAAFSATGDPLYVEKVISYIHLYRSNGETFGARIGETALMSLANNAIAHEKVSKICQEEAADHPNPMTKSLLETMLRVVADSKAHDGSGTQLPAH